MKIIRNIYKTMLICSSLFFVSNGFADDAQSSTDITSGSSSNHVESLQRVPNGNTSAISNSSPKMSKEELRQLLIKMMKEEKGNNLSSNASSDSLNNSTISEQSMPTQNSKNQIDPQKNDTTPKFTCLVVSNVKGDQITDKTNYSSVSDSIDGSITFAIENTDSKAYLNDGVDQPFTRVKANVLQRDMNFMNKNDVIEMWTFDVYNKKALYTQVKQGQDIGNSVKAMTGDVSKIYLSDACKQNN